METVQTRMRPTPTKLLTRPQQTLHQLIQLLQTLLKITLQMLLMLQMSLTVLMPPLMSQVKLTEQTI